MECIKTGCHIFLEEYQEYAYGDAFELALDINDGEYEEKVLFFRLCARSRKPIRPIEHFIVRRIAQWWDADKTSMMQNSTLIASAANCKNHGYEGILIGKLPT